MASTSPLSAISWPVMIKFRRATPHGSAIDPDQLSGGPSDFLAGQEGDGRLDRTVATWTISLTGGGHTSSWCSSSVVWLYILGTS